MGRVIEKPFSYDPITGIRRVWRHDLDTDDITIETIQDEQPLLEENLQLRNQTSRHSRYGDAAPIARVSNVKKAELTKAGIWDDPVRMKIWLNSPDAIPYRVRVGKV